MKTIQGILAALLFCAGCQTIEVSSAGSMKDIPVKGAGECDRVISVRNTAWYVLWTWKLAGYDATIAAVEDAITAYAAKDGYDIVDLFIDDSSAISADVLSYGGLAGFFFGYGEVSGSATLRKRMK